jgi:dGTPase
MLTSVGEWHHRRFHEGDFSDNRRLEFSKDYDRILYSTAFRRLGGVTQVVAAGEIALFHTRLTHSLKTAQVGARLANHILTSYQTEKWLRVIERYGGIDPRVVRAACLAHDLGHPPFGHIAEAELKDITAQYPNRVSTQRSDGTTTVSRGQLVGPGYDLRDRFEGNAQSFRIVAKLAFREPAERVTDCPALNLTRGTLAAMLKYPWARQEEIAGVDSEKKWGYYDSEKDIVRWIFNDDLRMEGRKLDLPKREIEYRTLEAQIMDWADDISYAVHDVEDFFRAGIVPLDRLAVSQNEWDEFFRYAWDKELHTLFDPSEQEDVKRWGEEVIVRLFPQTPYQGSGADRVNLHKFASVLIRDVTEGTRLEETGAIVPDRNDLAVIELLKMLTWYYVIDKPSLESIQRGQRHIIRALYCNMIEWVEEVWHGPGGASRGSRRELPARLLEYLDIAYLHDPTPSADDKDRSGGKRISRAIIDYIASLTEMQAVELNGRLTGQSSASMLDSWFQI